MDDTLRRYMSAGRHQVIEKIIFPMAKCTATGDTLHMLGDSGVTICGSDLLCHA